MDPFAEMVDRAAEVAGLNDYQLSAAIGLMQPGNRVFGPKQVARLRRGKQRHYDGVLVRRLIEVLELSPTEAWAAVLEASGLEPPEDVQRELWGRQATRRMTAASRVASREGATFAADPLTSDLRNSTTATLMISARQRVAA